MVRARTIAYVLFTAAQRLSEKEYDAFVKRVQLFAKARGIGMLLPQAYRYLYRMAAEAGQPAVARLTTAHEISASLIKDILAFAGATGAPLEHHIDPEVLGGFRITHDHLEHDATLALQLDKLQQTL